MRTGTVSGFLEDGSAQGVQSSKNGLVPLPRLLGFLFSNFMSLWSMWLREPVAYMHHRQKIPLPRFVSGFFVFVSYTLTACTSAANISLVETPVIAASFFPVLDMPNSEAVTITLCGRLFRQLLTPSIGTTRSLPPQVAQTLLPDHIQLVKMIILRQIIRSRLLFIGQALHLFLPPSYRLFLLKRIF